MVSNSSRLLAAAGLSLILLLGGCKSSKPVRAAGGSVKPESQRKQAPDFSLKDGDGRTVRLADYRGKIVLLNFWATWCGPCKIEMPWFMDFERRYKDQGFAVIGVSMDEEGWSVVKPFLEDLAVNYRILLGDATIAELYGGVEALPTTFLIDREGRVAATHVGLAGKSQFEDGIQTLLASTAAGISAGAK